MGRVPSAPPVSANVTCRRRTNMTVDLVTFLFTDIEGSTRLWEEHRDRMRKAVERHYDLTRSVVHLHGGAIETTTGDGVLALFTDALHGLRAAVDLQLGLAAVQVDTG